MQEHQEQGHEVLLHSPRGQPGLLGKVRAGVGRMIAAVRIYFCLGFYGQLPAPWSGVWVREWGVGQGCSGQRVWEGVRVEDGKNSLVFWFLMRIYSFFSSVNRRGSMPTAFAERRVIMGRHPGVMGSNGPGGSNGS